MKAARKAKTVLAVNYNCRFFPAILQMRAAVQRGDLGKIIHVQGHFFQDWLLKETDYNWRVLASEGGKLRAVGDIGTHWIDAVSFILGQRVESLFATLETFHKTRKRPARGGEDFCEGRPEEAGEFSRGYGGFCERATAFRWRGAGECGDLAGGGGVEVFAGDRDLWDGGEHALGSAAAE